MRRIYDAIDIIEANIVRGLIEQQNIEVHVSGFYLQGGIGEIPVTGNTSLWVNEEDASRAEKIVDEYQQA